MARRDCDAEGTRGSIRSTQTMSTNGPMRLASSAASAPLLFVFIFCGTSFATVVTSFSVPSRRLSPASLSLTPETTTWSAWREGRRRHRDRPYARGDSSSPSSSLLPPPRGRSATKAFLFRTKNAAAEVETDGSSTGTNDEGGQSSSSESSVLRFWDVGSSKKEDDGNFGGPPVSDSKEGALNVDGMMDDVWAKFIGNTIDDDAAAVSVSERSTPTLSTVDERGRGEDGDSGPIQVAALGAIAIVASILAASAAGLIDLSVFSLPSPAGSAQAIQRFFADPSSSLESVVNSVESMGSLGFVYFGVVYTVAEILAIPAIPLTASAGYLFGVKEGTAVVLASASIAAAISFIIGRTLLRNYVEGVLEEYPKFRKIDKAIGREGFKLMLLLRLSPVFPFALSNYLYGATSVKFWPYFWGTMLGFTPGTIAYVYTGEIGKALTLEAASAEPWYVYVGALALLSGFLKVVADVATGVIESLDEEEGETR